MAMFGIGAFYKEDVSKEFIRRKIVGMDWNEKNAPELHLFFRSLKVGDIVYIKSVPKSQRKIGIKAIGLIRDVEVITVDDKGFLVTSGRNVKWLHIEPFFIQHPKDKNNVRNNTIYEEFHPDVQKAIIDAIEARGVKQ